MGTAADPVAPRTTAKVALAARSAFHERLIAEALAGLPVELVPLPAELEKARPVFPGSRAVILQSRWRGGEGAALLRALKGDPRTRALPIVCLASGEDRGTFEDLGAEHVLDVPGELGRLAGLVRKLTRTKRLILHADDSAITRKTVRDFLVQNGYEVESAEDGQDALEKALALAPDMIVTDVEMPRMNGWDLCRAVKDNGATRQIPVLIVSSLADATNVERGLGTGADDYITKPIDWNELLSRIQDTFRGRELRGRERVLVCEDSAPMRHALQQALARQGFEVVTASDGDEGVQKALDLLPEVIVTDYEMPRLDGFQLFQYLKQEEKTRSIPVIMISGRDSLREQRNLSKAGVRMVLTKEGLTPEKLVTTVERLVAERRLEREKEHLKHYVSEDAWAAAHLATGQSRAEEVEVAVLFSDICGFTSKCEKLSARQIVDLLNEYFDKLCPAVKNNHGSIDKFVGDCIMAVFHGHDGSSPAEDAVRAGIELQRVLHEEFNKDKPEPFENRVGINAGLVVQGDIGARDYRRDYTVIGDVVNIASRLEGAADHGTTLVSEAVYEKVKHLVEAVPRPEPLKLKGKETKVNAWKITRIAPRAASPSRPAAGGGAGP